MSDWEGRELTEREQIVLQHIRNYPDLGSWNIARALHIANAYIIDDLFNLFFHGLIDGRDIPWASPSGYKRIWRASEYGVQEKATKASTVVSRSQSAMHGQYTRRGSVYNYLYPSKQEEG